MVQMSDTQRHLNSDLEVVVSIRRQGLGSLKKVGCISRRKKARTPRVLLR